MRQLFAFLFIYVIFVIQIALIPIGPDFIVLVLIFFVLHENRLIAALLGVFAGFCLDLVAPVTFGAHTLALGVTAYTIALIRNLFYRTRWHNILFALFALTLKTGAPLVFGGGILTGLPILISFVLTLVLSPFIDPVLVPLFYRKGTK